MTTQTSEKQLSIIEVRQAIKTLIEKNHIATNQLRIDWDEGFMQCILLLGATLKNSDLFQLLVLIKKQLPHVRVDAIDNAYLAVRDLGKNAYQPLNPLEGLRIRMRKMNKGSEIEMKKKGSFHESELYLFSRLVEFCSNQHNGKQQINPTNVYAELIDLGVHVVEPYAFDKSKTTIDKTPIFPGFVGYQKTRKEIFQNIIIPLTHPEIFDRIKHLTRKQTHSTRMAIPKAILFIGPPGVGKTTVARFLAQLSNIPLLQIPIDKILSKYYGQSEHNLAQIFELAVKLPQAILFIDELDALATSRNNNIHETTRRLLSIVLTHIDGFQTSKNLLVIGATNRMQDLDNALLSRFDTNIYFGLPDHETLKSIFKYYAQHLTSKELDQLATLSQGLSGRDIENISVQAERKWAHHLIQNSPDQRIEISPPTVNAYLDMIRAQKVA